MQPHNQTSFNNPGELEVLLLLQQAKLTQYFDSLVNHGGDDIQQLIDLLKEPKEFDKLLKLIGMDRKPLHIQRFKKVLCQWSSKNIIQLTNNSPTKLIYPKQISNINTNQINSNCLSFLSGINPNLLLTPQFTNTTTTDNHIHNYNTAHQNDNSFINSLTNPDTNNIMNTNLGMNSIQTWNSAWNLWNSLNNFTCSPLLHSVTSLTNFNSNVGKFTQITNENEKELNSIYNQMISTPDLNNQIDSPKLDPDELHFSHNESTPDKVNEISIQNRTQTQSNSNQIPNQYLLSPLPSTLIQSSSSENGFNLEEIQSNLNSRLIRPSASLMKSDFIKLDLASNALIHYLPKFRMRILNLRNSNEKELQEILDLPKSDPNRVIGLKKLATIFGRSDATKRQMRPLRHFEIMINEITSILVEQIPELVTQREHLFHIARQIVNISNYGLNVSQNGQVSWKMLELDIFDKTTSEDNKLSCSEKEPHESDFSTLIKEEIIKKLRFLKTRMQILVDDEDEIRTKMRTVSKDENPTLLTNLRRDLDNLVGQLHESISQTAKHVVLLKNAEQGSI